MAQERTDRAWERATETNFKDFVRRGDRANYDQKLDNIFGQLDRALGDLERNARANGYHQSRAAPMGLWSVGMNDAKTTRVTNELIEVANTAEAFANDPVYGPWIQQQQAVLFTEIEAAMDKYQTVMNQKYTTDARFKQMADAHVKNVMDLGNELNNPNGWTFQDNTGSLGQNGNRFINSLGH